MKAVVNTAAGIQIQEAPEPEPADDEAIVAVEAFSINRGEIALLKSRTHDWRPGQDIAGVIVTPARDGSGPGSGARVAALVESGGWSQRVAVPTHRMAVLPDDVAIEQAASLPLVGLTALRTLRLGGSLLGRRVLITGAGGAVGTLQAQLAVATGAEVTAVGSSRRRDQVLKCGVDQFVTHADLAEGLFGLVADWVGGPSLASAIAKVAPGGIVVLGSGNTETTPLNIYSFLGHEGARLIPYLSYAHPEPPAEDLKLLLKLLSQGRLTPPIATPLDWRHISDVVAAVADRRLAGKAVLTISG